MTTRGYEGNRLAKNAIGRDLPHLQPPNNESPGYKRIWESVVQDFPPTHFRESDRGTLNNYVRVSLLLRQTERQLERAGLLVEGPHGLVENPLLKTVDKLTRNLLAHARALKITPLSRNDRKQVPKESEHLKRQLAADDSPGAPGLKLAS